MGKRKARRLAALGGGGRRVKLDLFAEPSGDAVGSTVNHEVSGCHEQNGHPVVPVPSSSGAQRDGSLSLIGQYSDNDLADEEIETNKSKADEIALDACIAKTEGMVAIFEDSEPLDANAALVKSSAGDVPDARITATDDDVSTLKILNADDCGADQSTEQKVSGDSAAQIVGDVADGWKLVMHEESNQYYYWNTVTGETSWEVPHVLPKGDQKSDIAPPGGSETYSPNLSNFDLIEKSNEQLSAPGFLDKLDDAAFASRNCGDLPNANMVATVCDREDYKLSNLGVPTQTMVDTTFDSDNYHVVNYGSITSTSDKQFNLPNFEEDLPARIIKQGKDLLDRFHSVNESNDLVKKCITEVEIRLSDCEILSPYGSALLPFWCHVETRFKQLEYHIPGTEVIQCANFELPNNYISAHEVSLSEVIKGTSICFSDSGDEHIVSQQIEPSINNVEDAHPTNDIVISPFEQECGQDVDMDVDMEIDNERSSAQHNVEDAETLVCSASFKVPVFSDDLPKSEFVVSSENSGAPLPLEEDWIPPPPPDNEPPSPPPPPPPSDEPTNVSYSIPAPYTELLTSVPFDGYNISYSGTGYEYYTTPVSQVSSSSYYTPLEGSQIADLNQLYYGQAGLIPAPTAAIANPIVSAVYYSLPDGSFSSENVGCAIDSAGNIGKVESFEPDKVQVEPVGSSGVPAICETPELTTNLKLDSHISVSDSFTLPPLDNNSAADLLGISTKNQPKATRTKKRTISTISMAPSLKGKKKVSSLVDKWKAAKEELREEEEQEEEDPEDSYEALEKKKQREIEEWRAQTISSGHALENANFQPLGGDWRERVKRRRAESNKSTRKVVQASETVSSGKFASNGVTEPDLVDLSKNLPAGWQVCWDEQTKKVYYANMVTSMTTWTRPT